MAASILVAYATRYGSTKEVANAVGGRLRELGFEVEVGPVRRALSLDGYSAVVLGTPFYIGSVLREAREFLNRHKEPLARMPVALFALGPTAADDNAEAARAQLDGLLGKSTPLSPFLRSEPRRRRGLPSYEGPFGVGYYVAAFTQGRRP